jgi:hypothetical protein
MRTIMKVPIEPVYVEFIPTDLEECKIYISKKYNTSSHLCLCGCKELTVLPLMKGEWSLNDSNGKVTLTPSIGNYQLPCKSHYIITNNVANFV